MPLLLDTAAFIFAAKSPERLSKSAADLFANPENVLMLSAISLAEIAIKCAIGKLEFPLIEVQQGLEDLDVRVLSFTTDHVFRLFDLPVHHTDPFDRQIIAQALSEKVPIVTSDQKFRLYEGLKVIW